MAHICLKSCIPVRAVIWIMCFTCTLFLYMLRINLSIIILAMVDPSSKDNKTNVPECTLFKQNSTLDAPKAVLHSDIQDYGTRYDWSPELQGMILGSYFWGFTIAGFPGGSIAEKFGPSKCVTISFLVSGALTLIGPWAAALNPWVLIVSRLVIGLFGGIVFPSLHCLVARWAPPEEKGKFMGALLGGSLGTVITWPLLGYIIETFGWSWAFFGSGAIVIIWTASWFLLVTDTPEHHRSISDEEKKYIMESLSEGISKVKRFPPYKEIFITIPFWALLILHFGNLWGLFFLMTAGPNFLSSVLGFTLGHTGILASLPYLARLIFGIIFGQIGDFIMKKRLMEKTTIRKSFILFSHFLPGLFLCAQTFVGCNVTWAIVLITMSLGMNGASTLTNLQNSQDLSPNFAGTLYGIINCVGSITGFINPAIVGYLTTDHNGLEEWHSIFYIGSSVYVASGIIFCLFGTAEKQIWNDISPTKPDTNGVENIGFEDVTSV